MFYNVHMTNLPGKKVVIAGRWGDSAVDWANPAWMGLPERDFDSPDVMLRAHEHSVELLHQSSVNVMTPCIAT